MKGREVILVPIVKSANEKETLQPTNHSLLPSTDKPRDQVESSGPGVCFRGNTLQA